MFSLAERTAITKRMPSSAPGIGLGDSRLPDARAGGDVLPDTDTGDPGEAELVEHEARTIAEPPLPDLRGTEGWTDVGTWCRGYKNSSKPPHIDMMVW